MSRDRGEELQDNHNKGEKDCSDDKYEQPHTVIPLLDDILYGSDFVDQMNEDNDAYNSGWSNTYNQK